jgi:regulator of sigma E protease
MQITLFILALILFISLVLVHEWGHYIVARRNGVLAEEFGLGFPPRAWGHKLKSGMILSLNWLPLGGFVKLKGEHDLDSRRGSFGAATTWVKTKILLAGVTMNLLVGLIMLTCLAFVGMPKLIDNQFTVASDTKVISQEIRLGYIDPGSPAAKAGLKSFDKVIKISANGQTYKIKTAKQLHDATHNLAGKQVSFAYQRGKTVKVSTIQLLNEKEVAASKKTSHPKGYLGVVPTPLELRRSTWSAPIVAVGFTKQLIVLTIQGLGQALAGLGSTIAGLITGNHAARINGQAEAGSQVGGPVAIIAVLWGGGSLGLIFVLTIIAIISLTLALMNILPIPALDGGRLAVMLFSRKILRRPVNPKWEEWIHGTGMAILLGLIFLITIADVRRFI